MKVFWGSLVLLVSLWDGSEVTASPMLLEAVEWKFSRRLYHYRTYGSISLERVELPLHTLRVNFSLNAFSHDDSCDIQKVNVFSNQYGIPVVSRNGEIFPKDSHVPDMVPNITMTTNNKTLEWVLTNQHEGSLFVMAIMPHDDTRIRQKGLYVDCQYFMTLRAVIQYYEELTVPVVTSNLFSNSYMMNGGSRQLMSFQVPIDTSAYKLKVNACGKKLCELKVFLWDTLSPDMWEDNAVLTMTNGTQEFQRTSPKIGRFAYIGLDLVSKDRTAVNVEVIFDACTKAVKAREGQAICIVSMIRETPSGSDVEERFTTWDGSMERPASQVSMNVSDDTLTVLRFDLRGSDSGVTLNIDLHKLPKTESEEIVEVMLCAAFSTIVSSRECPDGAVVKVNSSSKAKKMSVMIPYPQSGTWYLVLQSRCFLEGSERRSNDSRECTSTPQANLTVSLSKCARGSCGQYGKCSFYTSAGILFSACDCYEGWRGYGCNDGSRANSLTKQKVSMYLLTLSNLGFIPGIVLAIYRRFFLEAFVYTFNMVFSILYHACDTNSIYRWCLMAYETHSFADFFGSLISFVVTLLAMARISIRLRAFLHMVAAMMIAVGEVYNRYGLFEQLAPIVGGFVTVIVTWAYVMYTRKSLFPSKRRYLLFILPGLVLAGLGLILNLAVQTRDNYPYVHSAWHVLVSAAIVFLLPPRHKQKQYSMEQLLSAQSRDELTSGRNSLTVTGNSFRTSPSGNDSGINFHNAGEAESASTSESLTNGNRGIGLFNRGRGQQNYVL